jgi:hypothetical protein
MMGVPTTRLLVLLALVALCVVLLLALAGCELGDFE